MVSFWNGRRSIETGVDKKRAIIAQNVAVFDPSSRGTAPRRSNPVGATENARHEFAAPVCKGGICGT